MQPDRVKRRPKWNKLEITFLHSSDRIDRESYNLEYDMLFFKKTKLSKEEKKYMQFLAYDTLVELNEISLPVIDQYASAYEHGIRIYSMQYAAQQLGEKEDYFLLEGCSECFAEYVGGTEHYLILYNDHLPADKRRWYISKAIALIRLGLLDNSPNEFFSIQRHTTHSDEFSYYFTCPDVVLSECNIFNPSDIIKYCCIPFFYANRKSMYLARSNPSKSLRRLDEIIKTNFSPFIHKKTALHE